MNIVIQNQPDGRPRRPTRQLCRAKTYRVKLVDMLNDGQLDTSMVKWCEHRRDDGALLILMAQHGKEYARIEARRLGIESLFMW